MEVDHRFIVQRLMNLDVFYVLHTKTTHEPFVEYSEENLGDQIYIFEGQEEATNLARVYAARHYVIGVAEVKKEQYNSFFTSLFLIGADTVVFNCNGEDHVMKLDSFVKFNLPEEKPQDPPKKNDVLQLTMIYYLQEKRRVDMPADDPERKQKLDELEEEMWANVSESRFILPLIPGPDAKSPDDVKKSKVYLVKTKDGQTFQPIFSDMWECQKFFQKSNQKMALAIMPFEALKKGLVNEAKGYLVNPSSTCLPILKAQLK